jgi:hypothetical protein
MKRRIYVPYAISAYGSIEIEISDLVEFDPDETDIQNLITNYVTENGSIDDCEQVEIVSVDIDDDITDKDLKNFKKKNNNK